jgi:hypothetical protein
MGSTASPYALVKEQLLTLPGIETPFIGQLPARLTNKLTN